VIQISDDRIKSGNLSRRRGDYGDYLPPEFEVTYQPLNNGVYNIYLFGVIQEASQFVTAIEAFSRAGEHDVVVVHLSTDGGSLDATDTFLQSMRECEARVIVKATGGVHSAGTVILLNADEFILSENFNCLIHNGSAGSYGKISDFRAQAGWTIDYMERTARSTYEGFLSPDEIEALIKGQDFWFNAQQFGERWERRNELLKQEHEEHEGGVDADVLAEAEEQMMSLIEDAVARKTKRSKKM